MLITIIIILILALSALAVGVNAIQQHKQKTDLERRQQLLRYRGVLDQTEDLIAVCSDFPLGKSIVQVLRVRARDALKLLVDIQPKSNDLKTRLDEYEQAIAAYNPEDKGLLLESFTVPEGDKQIVTMIKALKRIRQTLRAEHGRNRVDSQTFHEEETRIEKLLIKISVESLVRRGDNAKKSNMLGSARQYYEKAVKMLGDTAVTDDYVTEKAHYIDTQLEEIMSQLRDSNAADAKKRNKKDDLDELFQPKKKW
ncbi:MULTISPECIES: hypothetical protein [Gammaproteobacteria]|uniref:hypothetical protein n=1 Tax=Gammaproteobacteria TaxID=1236 RepID=UPI000DD0C7ED|nr:MULTISPECIES: hypothetical protein [Gammaproteobacteria]RTE87536.1 hypothetical protein DQX04_03930 [Aliidiomarina sp. B3213]TCZ92679.1 hypothetical protein EYQ95_01375 [Lysobacter sp. N42]